MNTYPPPQTPVYFYETGDDTEPDTIHPGTFIMSLPSTRQAIIEIHGHWTTVKLKDIEPQDQASGGLG